jgi:hypothetical protein
MTIYLYWSEYHAVTENLERVRQMARRDREEMNAIPRWRVGLKSTRVVGQIKPQLPYPSKPTRFP